MMQPSTAATLAILMLTTMPRAQLCDVSTSTLATSHYTLAQPFDPMPAVSIGSGFQGANLASFGATIYFDFEVSADVLLRSVIVQCNANAGMPVVAELYRSIPWIGYSGNETDPSAWTPRASVSGVSAGPGAATRLMLSEPLYLPAGASAFALTGSSFRMLHEGSIAQLQWADGTALLRGASMTAQPFVGPVQPVTPNLAVEYTAPGPGGTVRRLQIRLEHYHLSYGNTPGLIRDLALHSTTAGRLFCNAIQVRIAAAAPTFNDNLQDDLDGNLEDPVTVFYAEDFSWAYSADEWAYLGLDTPYWFDGLHDVVVEIITRGAVVLEGAAFHADGDFWLGGAYASAVGPTPTIAQSTGSLGPKLRFVYGCPSFSVHGSSCGRLRAGFSGSGAIGETFTFSVHRAVPAFFAVGVLGFQLLPSPVPLAGIGWLNCSAYLAPDVLVNVGTDLAGVGSHTFAIPDVAALVGTRAHAQWLQLDPFEPGGVSVSDRARLTIGL